MWFLMSIAFRRGEKAYGEEGLHRRDPLRLRKGGGANDRSAADNLREAKFGAQGAASGENAAGIKLRMTHDLNRTGFAGGSNF